MDKKERSVEDIRAELAENRAKLRVSIGDFQESIKPRNVLKSGVDDVKQFAKAETEEAKKQFVDEEGNLRTKRVLAIAGAVVGAVAFVVTVNVLAKRAAVSGPKARKAIEAK